MIVTTARSFDFRIDSSCSTKLNKEYENEPVPPLGNPKRTFRLSKPRGARKAKGKRETLETLD